MTITEQLVYRAYRTDEVENPPQVVIRSKVLEPGTKIKTISFRTLDAALNREFMGAEIEVVDPETIQVITEPRPPYYPSVTFDLNQDEINERVDVAFPTKDWPDMERMIVNYGPLTMADRIYVLLKGIPSRGELEKEITWEPTLPPMARR